MPVDILRSLVFDRPLGVYITLGVVWLASLAAYRYRQTRARRAMLIVPILLAACVFFVERAVVTDREQIVEILHGIAADTEAGHTWTLEQCLDDDFEGFEHAGFDLGKSDTIRLVRWAMDAYGVKRAGIMRTHVQVRRAGDWPAAEVRLGTLIVFDKSSLGPGRTTLKWEIDWVRRPDGWKIIHVAKPQHGLAFAPADR